MRLRSRFVVLLVISLALALRTDKNTNVDPCSAHMCASQIENQIIESVLASFSKCKADFENPAVY